MIHGVATLLQIQNITTQHQIHDILWLFYDQGGLVKKTTQISFYPYE